MNKDKDKTRQGQSKLSVVKDEEKEEWRYAQGGRDREEKI
jgi:hypothetical protein